MQRPGPYSPYRNSRSLHRHACVVRAARLACLATLLCLPLGACDRSSKDDASKEGPAQTLVVYTAHDRQFSEPILKLFTVRTGIQVEAVYDTESTKTVGLVNRIRAEAQRPRCDVFWNNEVLNTLRLKSEGLLVPCNPPRAADFPADCRDADGHWFGFAARARVLIVNTQQVKPDEMPTSIRDLADPRWRGRIGIAKPLFGTTATHVACLFAKLGEDEAKRLLLSCKENGIQVLGGNKAAAELVGAGKLAFSLTDTDDAVAEVDAGRPVRIVFPDAGEGQMGTLLLPNTLMAIRGRPNQSAAEKLINFLLSPEIEMRLAEGEAAQIPLNPKCAGRSRIWLNSEAEPIKPMEVDWARAADAFTPAAEFIEQTFLK